MLNTRAAKRLRRPKSGDPLTAGRSGARLKALGVILLPLTMIGILSGCGSRLSYRELLNAATIRSGGGASGGSASLGSGGASTSSSSGTGTGPGATGSSGSPTGSGSTRSSGSGSRTAGASASAASCSGSKSPITIGTVGEESGIVGGLVIDQIRAVQAWVAYINASRGGIDCHPVRYITADDGGDPSRNQALTQQLVEQDHVIAFVNMTGALAGNASINYLTQKGIPVIGDEGGEQWFYQSPDYFPQESSGSLIDESTFAALGEVGKATGQLKLGTVSCVEASVCSAVYTDSPQFAQKFGLNLVYRGQASLTQPDFTSSCQAAQQAGAQLFLIGLDMNSVQRLLQDCQNIGYHPVYGVTSASVNATIANNPLANNMVIGLPNALWNMSGNAAISEFRSVMAQYAPGVPVDLTSEPGWVSAKLFQLASQSVPDPPTSQGILSGLWALKNNDVGGLTTPLTFTQGQDAPQVFCYWVGQVKNKGITSPNGGARACD